MNPSGDYRTDGYLALQRFLAPEVATGFLTRLKADLAQQGVPLDRLERDNMLLSRKAIELYGYHYSPIIYLLWGMTPAIQELVGEDLLPTYGYFRLYRAGDICKVHGDRYACEHSISLTLAYSDGIVWPLEVGRRLVETPHQRADDSFTPEDEPRSVPMEPGDAVLYQGVHHHHGRTSPNPNRWSAHLFLHWVARAGPYAEHAFDGQPPPKSVSFL